MAEFTKYNTDGVVSSNGIPGGTPTIQRATGFFLANTDPAGGAAGEGEDIIIEVERSILYEKRGFNTGSLSFEYWQTEDPEGAPPSGDPLIDITIMGQTT